MVAINLLLLHKSILASLVQLLANLISLLLYSFQDLLDLIAEVLNLGRRRLVSISFVAGRSVCTIRLHFTLEVDPLFELVPLSMRLIRGQ